MDIDGRIADFISILIRIRQLNRGEARNWKQQNEVKIGA
jgi:hypothetical protein